MANKLKEIFKLPQVLVILGPTASGKTRLGVELALAFNGEIISADSRQVYKGMDIGTGKDLNEYILGRKKVKHHLLDVVQPNTKFDLAKYQKLAFKAINEVLGRGRLPIIVGGSGLYLQAVVDNYQLAKVKPDLKRRAVWEKLTAEKLFQKISRKKPEFAARLNNSERYNQRRLIRYLEIIESAGDFSAEASPAAAPYDFLILGITWPDDVLRERIRQRLADRLENQGLIEEVRRLHQGGVSWQRLIKFGLEYKFVSYYLRGRITRDQLFEQLNTAIYRFAKRQKTWFRRWEKQGQRVIWVEKGRGYLNVIRKWLQA